MTPDMDESARILTRMIRDKEPFFYARIGDGAIELLSGKQGATCDGEVYTPELAGAMREAIRLLYGCPGAFYGDWSTATNGSAPRYVDQWLRLIDGPLLHFEALLLNRESEALVDFYRAVREDARRKVVMGPRRIEGANFVLLTAQIGTPINCGMQLLEFMPMMEHELDRLAPELLLFGAGMAGLVAAVRYWAKHPGVTCVHLGSALDPLFHGKTRNGQLSQAKCREMFKELL